MSQVIYCLIFKSQNVIHTDITESLERVKTKYEHHKKTNTLHQFTVIKHTKIKDTTEFEFEPLNFSIFERSGIFDDLRVATYD